MNLNDHNNNRRSYDNYNYDHEVNLLNNSVTYDQIREKSAKDDANKDENDLYKTVKDLHTTETDMMFNLFANKEKLVNEENMKNFDIFI